MQTKESLIPIKVVYEKNKLERREIFFFSILINLEMYKM
jgi:hypothetical protein